MKKKIWHYFFLGSFVIINAEVTRSTASKNEQIAIISTIKHKILPEVCRSQKVKTMELSRTSFLKQKCGAFVTLYKNGKLRGCVGRVYSYDKPLYETIPLVAQLAALEDSRFSTVKCQELPQIEISVSVLTQPQKIASYRNIKIGKHGIILRKGNKSAVFLPKVPVDRGWSREKTLMELARKAGLPDNVWKENDVTFEVFESYDFPKADNLFKDMVAGA